MSGANYSGRQANNTSYIKNFVYGTPVSLWKTITYTKLDGTKETVITPSSSKYENLYVPGDLFLDGSIINPSDINLKKNITLLDANVTDKMMNLKPSSFEFKDDPHNNIHYGFIAGELENEYPELVQTKPDAKYSKIKSVNYLEMIPLLVHKMQIMQKEIDELKNVINSSNINSSNINSSNINSLNINSSNS
jgi:hypothetical protein